MKKIKPKTVTVHWVDAHDHTNWETLTPELVASFDVARCVTTGTILRRDKKRLVVAQTVSVDDSGYINGVTDVLVIPAPWVVKVKR